MFYRLINLVGAALFLYAAAVQYNDPDALSWMLLYGAAAAFCALAVSGRAPPLATGTFGVSCLVLAYLSGQTEPGAPNPMAGFPSWEPLREEVVRETLGLALVGLWMLGLSIATWRRRAHVDPD